MSQRLIEHTHDSIHLITPFDSGGSSAALRKAFSMPAVGDLRNRLMALADRSVVGHAEIYALFAYRFPADVDDAALRVRLRRLVEGRDDRVRQVPEPLRSPVLSHLGAFQEAMPADFDLRGANIGNLVLAGGYLREGRRLGPVLDLFSRLVEVRGTVRPIVDEDLHLAARLADGRMVVGQHRITGKGGPPLDSPVDALHLTRSLESTRPVRAQISESVEQLILSADLICYPIGSFYSSLLATLLPDGVTRTIARASAPKVYVPNPGDDPEEVGLTLLDKVRVLLRQLGEGVPVGTPTDALVQLVLVDLERTPLSRGEIDGIEEVGPRVIDARLVSPRSDPLFDDALLVRALLSLV